MKFGWVPLVLFAVTLLGAQDEQILSIDKNPQISARMQKKINYPGVEEKLFDAVFRAAEDLTIEPKLTFTEAGGELALLDAIKVTVRGERTVEQMLLFACEQAKVRCHVALDEDGKCEIRFFRTGKKPN